MLYSKVSVNDYFNVSGRTKEYVINNRELAIDIICSKYCNGNERMMQLLMLINGISCSADLFDGKIIDVPTVDGYQGYFRMVNAT